MNPVLIIQHSASGLKLNESKTVTSEKKYILEGVFTEFDVKNRNNRIYTADEFVPHVNTMMEKKNWGVVYGEFDHPDVFDISMKYVSHTIESATYNSEKNRIDGEIRLLSTQWGKEAKSLVDDGLPLFVSSRAAGVTEANDHVKLKQLFTYDIVADPGFPSARMATKPMNESFGFKTEENDFRIYSIPESKMNVFNLSDDSQTNDLFNMNKDDMVTKKQLADYSKHLAEQITKIKKDLTKQISEGKSAPSAVTNESVVGATALAEELDAYRAQQDKVIKYLDYIAEKVSFSITQHSKLEEKTTKMVDYSNYLAESLDKSIDYSNYIAENLDKNIDYSNYLAENLDKNIDYSNYLAENLDKSIDYSNYIAENLDKNIDYSNYLAENLDKNIDYANYLAENLDANIGYTEYLSENLDANIGYTEYLAENLDANINYSEYVAECTDKTMAYADMIVEKLNKSNTTSVNESIASADQFLITEKNAFAEKMAAAKAAKGGAKKGDKKDDKKPAFLKKGTKADDKKACADDKKACATDDKKSGKKPDFLFKKKGTKKEAVKESFSATLAPKESITNKIDTLIAEAKKREASKVLVPAFYAFLSTDDIKSFESLSQDEQEKAKVVINESAGYYSRHDVLKLVQASMEKELPTKERLVLESIPAEIQPIWESLATEEKKAILSQANFYELKSADLVEHFWQTRKFNTPINESKKLVDFSNPLAYTNTLSDAEIARLTSRF